MVTILVGLMAACGIATWLLCALGPLVWLDDHGFHYGAPDDEKDSPP